jgi:hypothetical protein
MTYFFEVNRISYYVEMLDKLSWMICVCCDEWRGWGLRMGGAPTPGGKMNIVNEKKIEKNKGKFNKRLCFFF